MKLKHIMTVCAVTVCALSISACSFNINLGNPGPGTAQQQEPSAEADPGNRQEDIVIVRNEPDKDMNKDEIGNDAGTGTGQAAAGVGEPNAAWPEPQARTTEEPATSADGPSADTPNSKDTSPTGKYPLLQPHVSALLSILDSDFSKVNWAVNYSPFEEEPEIVVSVAPYLDTFGKWNLVVGITNLEPNEVTVSGHGAAKTTDGRLSEDTYIFADSLGPGSTFIRVLPCDGIPTGSIHWEDFTLSNAVNTFVPWESDWSISSDAEITRLTLNSTIYSNPPQAFTAGSIYGLGVNENGDIAYVFQDYNGEESSVITSSADCYDRDCIYAIKDIALFVNPIRYTDTHIGE